MSGSDPRAIGILALLLLAAAGCGRPAPEAHAAGAEASSSSASSSARVGEAMAPAEPAPAVAGPAESVESARSTTVADGGRGNPIFAPVLPRLRSEVRIPLRLPEVLGWEDTPPDSAFAIVERADSAGYTLMIALASFCDGGNWCRYGNVSGERIAGAAKREAGTPVPLADGVTGHFVDATCGAVCSDSELWWDEGGVRYSVGVKAADARTLAAIARSALGAR
jgi:hypothetical protein